MSYTITDYTRRQAKKYGVTVKKSLRKGKKIAVFRGDQKLVDVGAIGYNDYPTFIRTKGKEYADERRKLYKIRHNKDRNKVGTPSYWADKLLW
jgi:hypothetical protein